MKKGFSTIELLVVIAIVGIVTTVILYALRDNQTMRGVGIDNTSRIIFDAATTTPAPPAFYFDSYENRKTTLDCVLVKDVYMCKPQ